MASYNTTVGLSRTHLSSLVNILLLVKAMVVIRQECGQTLARVRVSWTKIVSNY